MNFTNEASAGVFYRYCHTLSGAGHDQGRYVLNVGMQDLAGNFATEAVALPAPEIVVDTAMPADVNVDAADTVTYRRVPWGSAQTTGIKEFSVRGAAGAVKESGLRIFVYDAQDTATAAHLGTSELSGADGSFSEVVINRADRAEVFVTTVDAAGNESAAGRVRDIEWISTMLGKEVDSTIENPHRFLSRYWFDDRLIQGTTEELAGDTVGLADDAQSSTTIGRGRWLKLQTYEYPTDYWSGASVYDFARGRLVFWSHRRQAAVQPWEWDGRRWQSMSSVDPEGDGNPTNRTGAGLAYDSRRGVFVLFGGDVVYADEVRDTWEWNGRSWKRVSTTGPSARTDASMSYDAHRGQVILFGGRNGGTTYRDTWAWDGQSWTRVATTGPSARSRAGLAYDDDSQVIVMYGGSGGGILADTWEWNGTMWTERCDGVPAGDTCSGATQPLGHYGHGMAYDPERDVMVAFSGINSGDCPGDQFCNYTWEWNGSRWRRITITDPEGDGSPIGRIDFAMSYSPEHQAVVLFGGENEFVDCEGEIMWAWNGSSWRKIFDPLGAPAPALGHGNAMAYDAARDRVVRHAGDFSSTETWEWDGLQWASESTATPDPGDHRFFRMTYEQLNGTVLLFGARVGPFDSNSVYRDDTWRWNGSTWSTASTVGPPGRAYYGLTHNRDRDSTMMFGGFSYTASAGAPCGDGSNSTSLKYCMYQDAWEWRQDNTWHPLSFATSLPARRRETALAYDWHRQATVMFGGCSSSGGSGRKNDVWEMTWNAAGTIPAWSNETPGGSKPTARCQHTMVYDGERRKTVLFGGFSNGVDCGDGDAHCRDVWEWDGTAWSKRAPTDPEGDGNPSGRRHHSMTYDSKRGQSYIFEGLSSATLHPGLWAWDGGANSRPAHVMSVVASEAGIDGDESIERIDVRWLAGGTGAPNAATKNGATLHGWFDGKWRELDSNAVNQPSSASPLVWCAYDPAHSPADANCNAQAQGLDGLFFGPDRTLNVAAAPVANSGTADGTIITDYAEVTLSYRLPEP